MQLIFIFQFQQHVKYMREQNRLINRESLNPRVGLASFHLNRQRNVSYTASSRKEEEKNHSLQVTPVSNCALEGAAFYEGRLFSCAPL